MKRLTACLALIVAALGSLASVCAVRAEERRPVGMENRSMQEISARLRLTPEQKMTIAGVMRQEIEDLRALQVDTSLSEDEKRARVRVIVETAMAGIRATLTAEQLTVMDIALAEEHARSQRSGGESAESPVSGPGQDSPQGARP